MSIKILPFNIDYIEEAAALVALRYQAERAQNQLLPARFEQAEAIIPRLQERVGKVPGVAAIRDNRLVGFLLGLQVPLFKGVRGVFIPDWGHATDGINTYETYQEMYAELSRKWIANGCFTHAIQLFAYHHHEKRSFATEYVNEIVQVNMSAFVRYMVDISRTSHRNF